MTSTFRAGIVAAIVAMLNDYKAAHGAELRLVFQSRPESFDVDLPAAYVDRPILEGGVLDMQTHQRLLAASFTVVDRLTTNFETTQRQDALIDALVSHITDPAYAHLTPNTHWSRYSVTDGAEDGFYGVRITLEDLTEVTGRSST